MPTEADVREALRPVEDPELHRSIVDLDMVRGVAVDGRTVRVTVALTVAGCPLRAEITRRVDEAVSRLSGVETVERRGCSPWRRARAASASRR
jgi:ATP-binding protein involved in chromosome partitioning